MRKAVTWVLVLMAVGAFAQEKKKSYKVGGFVGQSTSQAAPGVTVALILAESGETVGTDETNFFGKYSFRDVPPGLYILQVEQVRRPLEVKNKNVRLDIDLSAKGGAMDYTKTGMPALNQALGQAASPGPNDPQMMQAIAGEYYSYSGSTEKQVMFCPDGKFSDSSESSYSGVSSDSLGNQNMAWGAAGQKGGSGLWAIQGTLQSGTITLSYKGGKKVTIKYLAGPEKGCYSFDGTTFCYKGSARCN